MKILNPKESARLRKCHRDMQRYNRGEIDEVLLESGTILCRKTFSIPLIRFIQPNLSKTIANPTKYKRFKNA
jgi:hypothetical protein